MSTPRIKHVADYGATGDINDNDLPAIQAALDDGDGIVVLMDRHNIRSGVLRNNNTNFITYFGKGKSELIGTNTRKIDNFANLKITNVSSSGDGFIALFTSRYDFLEISNCEFRKSIGLPVIRVATGGAVIQEPVISEVIITNNHFDHSSITLLDRLESKKVIFSHNFILNFQRFVLRIQFNDADSKVDKIVFDHNHIDGNLPPFSDFHKEVNVFQALAKVSIHYTNNVVKNLLNKTYRNELFLFFSSGGNVFMSNNHFENIRGLKSHLILDKNTGNHIWHIHDNVFDQRLVVDPFPKDFGNASIVNVANNTSVISNNLFLNPKSTSIVLGNSVFNAKTPVFPQNCMVSNNSFINVENHTAITVIQVGQHITIQGNKVDGLFNPTQREGNKESRTRFISFVNTLPKAFIEHVVIRENSISNMKDDGVLLWHYSLDVANGGEFIKLLNNYMDSGEALIRFRVNPLKRSEIIMNVLPAGTVNLHVEGTSEPVDLRVVNNVLS